MFSFFLFIDMKNVYTLLFFFMDERQTKKKEIMKIAPLLKFLPFSCRIFRNICFAFDCVVLCEKTVRSCFKKGSRKLPTLKFLRKKSNTPKKRKKLQNVPSKGLEGDPLPKGRERGRNESNKRGRGLRVAKRHHTRRRGGTATDGVGASRQREFAARRRAGRAPEVRGTHHRMGRDLTPDRGGRGWRTPCQVGAG